METPTDRPPKTFGTPAFVQDPNVVVANSDLDSPEFAEAIRSANPNDPSTDDRRLGAARVHPIVKIFVAFHLLAITVWAIPNPPERIRDGTVPARGTDHILVWNHDYLKQNPLLRGYLLSSGTWQYWDMFAPDPSQTDFYGTATVVYLDGTKKEYKYARMLEMDFWTKYLNERRRKHFERVHLEANASGWPRFAQRIAALMAEDPKNPPVEIVLHRHFQQLQRPGGPEPKGYNMYSYFEHVVDQQVLRKEMRAQGKWLDVKGPKGRAK